MRSDTDTPALPEAALLGRALRRWRLLNRVKQAALAEDLGLSQSGLSRWEAGRLTPGSRALGLARALLSARPASASDRALLGLVRGAAEPVHLVCDLTHRLLAASPARVADWRVSEADLRGRSLWRFASPEIVACEAGLAERGWYAPLAEEFTLVTGRVEHPEMLIREGEIRYTRLALSDGSFARLARDGARP
ncbi:helix-turn-helix domain-containing protein [Oceanicella sp. SM1341]|uniref:helix-turn-helix domain-containing protein n=1 Tax=Oceanicella sp. SM1341 TaxID=1548889 RepID=UPI000E547615|nr:helix-turn-helix transcriptional regulator [Oceanicella sp. SM1341]